MSDMSGWLSQDQLGKTWTVDADGMVRRNNPTVVGGISNHGALIEGNYLPEGARPLYAGDNYADVGTLWEADPSSSLSRIFSKGAFSQLANQSAGGYGSGNFNINVGDLTADEKKVLGLENADDSEGIAFTDYTKPYWGLEHGDKSSWWKGIGIPGIGGFAAMVAAGLGAAAAAAGGAAAGTTGGAAAGAGTAGTAAGTGAIASSLPASIAEYGGLTNTIGGGLTSADVLSGVASAGAPLGTGSALSTAGATAGTSLPSNIAEYGNLANNIGGGTTYFDGAGELVSDGAFTSADVAQGVADAGAAVGTGSGLDAADVKSAINAAKQLTKGADSAVQHNAAGATAAWTNPYLQQMTQQFMVSDAHCKTDKHAPTSAVVQAAASGNDPISDLGIKLLTIQHLSRRIDALTKALGGKR